MTQDQGPPTDQRTNGSTDQRKNGSAATKTLASRREPLLPSFQQPPGSLPLMKKGCIIAIVAVAALVTIGIAL